MRAWIVEPGPTRTYFHGSSSRATRTPNEAYARTAGARRQMMASGSGKQPGDPDRIAQIVVEVATEADPPLHLVCGRQALERVREKMAALEKDLDSHEARFNSSDFPA